MIIPSANRLSQVEEYYFSKKLAEVRSLTQKGRPIINLAIGNPDMPPSATTIETLNRNAALPNVHGYQPYRGAPELRLAMAEYYSRTYGVMLDANAQILPLLGSKEGIFHISMAFLNPGDIALVPDPGYLAYPSAARMAGGEPQFYDLSAANGWLPDLDALAKTDLSRTKIMWVNYPHMPTGATASLADFAKIIDFCREHKILLCHDNPYSRILNPNPLSLLQVDGALDCAIELNSLSKSHNMAGWRVGMLCGNADYLDTIIKVKSNIDSGQFLPMQLAAAQALQNSDEWHAEQNAAYVDRQQLVYRFLDALGCTYDSGSAGMFAWAKLPDAAKNAEAFVDDLLYSKDIFIAPGSIFGSNGRGYIRVSLCAPAEKIAEAVGRVS
ncbi:MAG: aminotransferase class I/II-fold pyridoxal phosphate-dependent enzyme [Calditrichaeota bacterium]|nr:aminotransferase class I/II-fold pyridoxal phosphate-dependent enzyme [Calditrichota bacterium]MCB0268185.1 aminotransferase class I/II-fold pyridoxal phosphate-dependent enzyme [Calditrichota bacterium]